MVGMVEGQKLWTIRRPFPSYQTAGLTFLLTCPLQHDTCHHSVLQGHHGSGGRRWRGGHRGQFLGGKQLETGFGVAVNCPSSLGSATCRGEEPSYEPQLRGGFSLVKPSLPRLATTDGRYNGLRMGTGFVETWLAASKNVPASRRPTPSSWLTGPASGGALWRRVSQYAGLPKTTGCEGGTLRTASTSSVFVGAGHGM